MRWVQPQHAPALLVMALLLVPSGFAVVDIRESLASPADLGETAPHVAPSPLGADEAWRGAGSLPGPPGLAPADPLSPPSALRIEPGVAWTRLAPVEFEFECPNQPGELFIDPEDPTSNVNVVRTQCPYRIIDDGDLLGSPQLAVRHDDPNEVAFFSLHGAASDNGPTPRSREPDSPILTNSGLSHTVFTSMDGGWLWADNPFGHEGLGETVSGVMNRDGHMFVASLFSDPLGVGPDGELAFDYHMRLHEERTVRDHVSHRGPRIDNMAPGNQIEEVNLVLVTPPEFVETDGQYRAYVNATKEAQEEQENGTPPPSNETDVGKYTIPREPGDHGLDIVAAVWHERAYDWRNASTGKSSWIQVASRLTTHRDEWKILDDEQLVGPCRSASNPVAWNGRIYVACVVDAGYRGRLDARIGDVDIWAIEPNEGTKRFVSHVPGLGPDGRPRLAANDAGRFAITASRIIPNADVDFASVELAWGWFGRDWSPAMDIGYQLVQTEGWGAQDLRTARVTAMELIQEGDAHILFLSYIERLNGTIPTDDPTSIEVVEYRKLVGSWEMCSNAPVGLYDLNVGLVRHPFQEGLVNDITGVFDDLHDGMAAAIDPNTGEHRLHFAYGDHGVIQYGAIDARSATTGDCITPPAPQLYLPPPPVPTPILLSTGVGVGTALGVTSVAALGFGSILVAKRRVALAAAVKAK